MSMSTYNKFIELTKEVSVLRSIESLLDWDQECNMPPEGVKDRSLQLASITTMIHEKLTSKTMAFYLSELKREGNFENLSPEQQANVREMAWEYHRASAIPSKLVNELAQTKSESYQNWTMAREKSDFKMFAPYLSKLVELKKQEAEYIGYESRPYDALLDGYEPGWTADDVDSLFSNLRPKLVNIVSKIIDSGIRPYVSPVTQKFPLDLQKAFNHQVAKDIGFDFQRGRFDEAPHPFTIGSLHDTRITTRYKEDDLRPALFATIHEGGHAMYEQGYIEEHFGTPMAQPVSFGIHESQSRMWENMVGRGRSFWKYYYSKLQSAFPAQLKDHDMDTFYAAINDVHPSPIRVEADEATYNLHILLRFDMENLLFTGKLEPEEAPSAWNERMEKYLQIEIKDNANGVLQDIHWSQAYFGYFPTYTLGNLYAAQFYDQVKKDIPDLESKIESGDFATLLNWLRENIHHKGRLLRAEDLLKQVTGKGLDANIFVNYLNEKYGFLYGF